jgi:hypothetical protein
MTSAEAVKQFQDKSVDFVYIDGNHDYKYAEEDIRLWYPKVKEGGFLCGDDVYSFDEKEHDSSNNVLRVWYRDSTGTPTCWGKYGTFMACKTNEQTFGIRFRFEENQFSVRK